MADDIRVVQAFDLRVSENQLSAVKKTHSYISDKLILDAVNGVKVVARDLHEVNSGRQSKAIRILDSFTGSARKRQDLINENVIQGISACTDWLRDHDDHISRIDGRICDVALELDRTQDEVLKFYQQHQALKVDTNDLREAFCAFGKQSQTRMNALEARLRSVDIRDEAHNSLDYEMSRAKAGAYDDLDVSVQIYTILDNLKSGVGGVHYDESGVDEKRKFKEHVSNHLKNYVSERFGREVRGRFVSFEKMIAGVNELDVIHKKTLSVISTQHYNEMMVSGYQPEISDLLSVVSSASLADVGQEIQNQSNIRTFITHDAFIDIATQEHLVV